MAAATSDAVLQRIPGATLVAAYPQVTPNGDGPTNRDLIQIVAAGSGSILLNVDYQGVVHNPAVAATTAAGGVGACRIGQFNANLTSSATTAQLFANAFTNLTKMDILQVINIGGNISYWLDYLGVAHGA